MGAREQVLRDKGYEIDEPQPDGPDWMHRVAIDGTTAYVSGHVAGIGLGSCSNDTSVEDAAKLTEEAMAGLLRSLSHAIGGLDNVANVIRVTGYVNCEPDFKYVVEVINGGSLLLMEVFGEAGRHARTALGMAQLPVNCMVEVEAIFKLKG